MDTSYKKLRLRSPQKKGGQLDVMVSESGLPELAHEEHLQVLHKVIITVEAFNLFTFVAISFGLQFSK